jgi:hypothetical protein
MFHPSCRVRKSLGHVLHVEGKLRTFSQNSEYQDSRILRRVSDRSFYGRASTTILTGVSAARRNRVNPPFERTSLKRRSPAILGSVWAPGNRVASCVAVGKPSSTLQRRPRRSMNPNRRRPARKRRPGSGSRLGSESRAALANASPGQMGKIENEAGTATFTATRWVCPRFG